MGRAVSMGEQMTKHNVHARQTDNEIRVLVVDDSFFMRSLIRKFLESDPAIRVVGTARNGQEGVKKVLDLHPDVVTLDVEMPEMDGLSALREIMKKAPCPVIMVSSVTEEGSRATFDALDLGAVDFIHKVRDGDISGIIQIRETLIRKVMGCALSNPSPRKNRMPFPPVTEKVQPVPRESSVIDVIVIGASTGGPSALQDVIPRLPETLGAAVIIVQHMPKEFTRAFAERLNMVSRLSVKEAEEGDSIVPGRVFIAPGGRHLSVERPAGEGGRIHLSDSPAGLLYRPSVDVAMESIARAYREKALGVIMTGMGCDGKEGMAMIKNFSGRTLAQDHESCVVDGMPGSAVNAGVVEERVPLKRLAESIMEIVYGEKENHLRKGVRA